VPEAAEETRAAAAGAGVAQSEAAASTAALTAAEVATNLARQIGEVGMAPGDLAPGITAHRLSRGRNYSLAGCGNGGGMARGEVLLMPEAAIGVQAVPVPTAVTAEAGTTKTETARSGAAAVTEQPTAAAESASVGSKSSGARIARSTSQSVSAPGAAAVTAALAAAVKQANGLVPHVFEAPMKHPHGLEGFAVVILRVMSIGDRRRIVRATGGEVVGWNFAWNGIVKVPAIGANPARAQSDDSGQCQRQR
jgi:hypothetical protein